jgi:primosomal protein N' (replication factor Y)
VLHQRTEKLHCHWCGFSRGFSPNCPRCDVTLEVLGRGTERVAEEIAELFPGVPIGRLDADTTDTRGAHARILGAFSAGETRILVGTQIVAKGHDFPGVHLAVVLGVDHALGMPDFRAAERVFSLVTQVAGRAGRGEVAGRVLVQTHHADHPVFAAAGDMDPFAERELNLRRLMGVPPYSRLALVRLESTSRPDAKAAAEAVARAARAVAGNYDAVDVLGPAAAPLAKLVGRWRFQVVLRGRAVKSFRAFLEREVVGWKVPSGVRKIVDVDPRSMA